VGGVLVFWSLGLLWVCLGGPSPLACAFFCVLLLFAGSVLDPFLLGFCRRLPLVPVASRARPRPIGRCWPAWVCNTHTQGCVVSGP